MKRIKNQQKLVLNKKTISTLSEEMNEIKGGTIVVTELTECLTCFTNNPYWCTPGGTSGCPTI